MNPSKKQQKRLQELEEDFQYNSIRATQDRARSITVGTAFGGVIEVMLRADTTTLYAQLQPTEAIEIIEQLASACGLQIALKPREDFARWRDWCVDDNIAVIWKGGSPWQLQDFKERTKELPQSKDEESSNEENTSENVVKSTTKRTKRTTTKK
jgi:hypothetical protein